MKFYHSNSLSFQIQWDTKIEPVYRLLDNVDYIENFFENGEIMISCLANFKKNQDEMQGDKSEGNAIVGEFGNGESNKHIIYEAGKNAYIMSTTKEITESVVKDFNAVGAIKIKNPTMFGHEIAKKLPFVVSGMEGNCDYKSSRVHFLEDETGKILNELDFSIPSSHYIFQQLTNGMELFLKLDKYKHQQEYRLGWFSKNEVENSIIVNCPEAIRYCDKIIF